VGPMELGLVEVGRMQGQKVEGEALERRMKMNMEIHI